MGTLYMHLAPNNTKTRSSVCLSDLKTPAIRINRVIREVPTFVVANVLFAMPAHAGKVFDFNATLPIMAAQFLILMVFLEKTWFGPVGNILDERDAKIRVRLASAKSGSDDLESLQNEADMLIKEARGMLNRRLQMPKVRLQQRLKLI